MDSDGYGYAAADRTVERLMADLRTFSPAGIERVAWGWDRHEQEPDEFRAAEKAALKVIEAAGRGPAWEQARRSLLDLTEGRGSLVSWKVEHGEVGHKAERAALGAALALMVADRIDHQQFASLARPMAEALPWLLPEAAPEGRRS